MAFRPSNPKIGAKSVPDRPTVRPSERLTELALRAAQPPSSGTITLWDGSLKNFGCRISSKGTRSFVVLLGSGRRHTIGRYPIVSLADARAAARRALAEKVLGKERPGSIGYRAAVAEFIDMCTEKNRPGTVAEYRRLLTSHFPLGSIKLSEITIGQIEKHLKALIGRPSEQRHAFVAIKMFFGWAQKRRYVLNNPCDALFGLPKPSSRSRVLSREELRAVLSQARSEIGAYGSIVQLLILTGQRRGEIAALQWDWINEKERTITLPASLCKNGREHLFPYGRMVADVLKRIPRQSPFLFPAAKERRTGKPATIFAGWNKPKAAFDARCKIAPWTLHDLRRTFATNLADLQVPPHVTERILNHASGTISGVAAIYNRHSYLAEMRQAIDAWETRLSELCACS
jgi:integrase